ncbi:MAG: zinc-ribbon domain-containing protein [Chitinophagaceae bacterium]|nr:MAG: zinc-ribbon domain-containing protein [Chitinophagaceae bacterium]
MIIYGTRVKKLATEHLPDKCPHCGTQNSLDLQVFQKYAHIFWIPFFPLKKRVMSQCDHCKQVLEEKEMPSSLAGSFESLKKQTKTPLWMFSGIGLLALLIIAIVVSEQNKDKRNAQLILTPAVGDLFKIKTKDNQYTLYKVSGVSSDSVIIQPSNYEVSKVTGLHKLEKQSFSDELFGFSKAELKAMVDNGEILDIER